VTISLWRISGSCEVEPVVWLLESMTAVAHIDDVSNKEIVADLLQRIPENASLTDIAREIEFVAAVRQGLAELDAGKGIPIEEVERELPSWIIK
jgi:predicted transcriptional regulator